MEEKHYFNANKKLWDAKTPHHVKSDFYNLPAFKAGKTSLTKIDLTLLPDLQGKKVLHLQCHFGQDTISMSRMGASCTGVDFSTKAIQTARLLATELEDNSQFVECNVYDLDLHIDTQFDLVFTSYGTIIWLPDLNRWAQQVKKRLVTGGRLLLIDFHPVLHMMDWTEPKLAYRYFNNGQPYKEIEQGTYADKDANIELEEYFWQHSMSDITMALIDSGLQVIKLLEYDYSPYDIFTQCEHRAEAEYVYKINGINIPHVFAIEAILN